MVICKRIVSLFLALTICLGMTATGFATKVKTEEGTTKADDHSPAQPTPPPATAAVERTPITKQDAKLAFDLGLDKEREWDTGKLTMQFANRESLSLDIMKDIVAWSEKAEVTTTVYADTTSELQVRARLIFQPGKATKDIDLVVELDSVQGTETANRFRRSYSNKLEVVHLGQVGSFGCTVEIAAKMELEGMNTDRLVFYAVDREKNTYQKIDSPSHRIDSNGYLHFYTGIGGDIVISDGELKR